MVGWRAVVMTEEPGLGPLEQAGRLNVRNWDEWAAVHGQDRYYDIAGFLAGASSLRTTELALSGDVAGLDLLHLQCHFGLDTLNWARLGARVTGLDFSGAPIGRAQALAEQAGLEASFVQADVLRLHASLFGGFDLVVGTYGVVLAAQTTVQWAHSLGEIVTALCRVGLCFGRPQSACLSVVPEVVGRQGRNRASTAACSRPLVATALPPWGPGVPSSAVNSPPASRTITSSGARSHNDTSGSAATSTAPSATRQ